VSRGKDATNLDEVRAVEVTVDGKVWEVRKGPDGSLQVWLPSGGEVFMRSECGNVVNLHAWPNFEPMRPPSEDSLVRVARQHIVRVLGGRGGLSREAHRAVQAKIDADPTFKTIVEGHIASTLELGGAWNEPQIRKG
jgi:hypothetical protein